MRQKSKQLVGNWKMNGGLSQVFDFIDELVLELTKSEPNYKVPLVICPPACLLYPLMAARSTPDKLPCKLYLGAQNCHPADSGAYTGEISAQMLSEIHHLKYCIVGHSERRLYFGEDDNFILQKAEALIKKSIHAILCVGETLAEREADQTIDRIEQQLEPVNGLDPSAWPFITIAYEPVWAIGTGQSATPEQAQAVHAAIRGRIAGIIGENAADEVTILYGGSVNAQNAASLFEQPDIDGALVGGASLKPDEFAQIFQHLVKA
jgi:triosephosphate isomerase (TIM)